MKRVINILSPVAGFVVLTALALMLTASPGGAQSGGYELVWGVYGGAHGTTTGDGYELRGQSGQFQPGTAGGGGYTLTTFLGGTPVLFGDTNVNGAVEVGDAVLVLRHIVELTTLTGNGLAASDVNKDGRVDVADAILILRYIVGLLPSLP